MRLKPKIILRGSFCKLSLAATMRFMLKKKKKKAGGVN